jgi:hypothetical protein
MDDGFWVLAIVVIPKLEEERRLLRNLSTKHEWKEQLVGERNETFCH